MQDDVETIYLEIDHLLIDQQPVTLIKLTKTVGWESVSEITCYEGDNSQFILKCSFEIDQSEHFSTFL